MADREDVDNESGEEVVVSPEVLLPKVEKKEKFTKMLSYSTLIIAVLMVATVGTGMIVMFSKISELERMALERESESLDEQFLVLEERLALIAEFRKSELKKISKYTKELDKLSSDCSAEKAEPFLKYLEQREDDFQQLIGVVKEGTTSLAGMNKGSRKWLLNNNKSLDELSKQSKDRTNQLSGIL